MILADKIIRLRKKNGWSQEELAEKMNVSRQAVSKWEGAQAIPDLEKILLLGSLFGVTCDYLLKDEMEGEEFTDDIAISVRQISLDEANVFLEWRKTASRWIAAATFLCIISPIPLLLLAAASESPSFHISEDAAGGIGLISLLIVVAFAVALFTFCGFKNEPYEFLEKEPFETQYGVVGMVRERQKEYQKTYMKCNILGTCICVLSPIALFIGIFSQDDFFIVTMLTLTMLIAGVGVTLFILVGVPWASMQKLLKEGEYSEKNRRKSNFKESVSGIYWLAATAIYLGWSFLTDDWHTSWIVWPIAGVLFAGVMAVCNLYLDRERE